MSSPDSKFKVVTPLRQPGTKLCIKLETTKTNATGMRLSVSLVWYLESKQSYLLQALIYFFLSFTVVWNESTKVSSHPGGHCGLHVVTNRQWDVAPGIADALHLNYIEWLNHQKLFGWVAPLKVQSCVLVAREKQGRSKTEGLKVLPCTPYIQSLFESKWLFCLF